MKIKRGSSWLPTTTALSGLRDEAKIIKIIAKEDAPINKILLDAFDDHFMVEINYPLPEIKLGKRERLLKVSLLAERVEKVTLALINSNKVQEEIFLSDDEKITLYEEVMKKLYKIIKPIYEEISLYLAQEKNYHFLQRKISGINEQINFAQSLQEKSGVSPEEFITRLKDDIILRTQLKKYGVNPDNISNYL